MINISTIDLCAHLGWRCTLAQRSQNAKVCCLNRLDVAETFRHKVVCESYLERFIRRELISHLVLQNLFSAESHNTMYDLHILSLGASSFSLLRSSLMLNRSTETAHVRTRFTASTCIMKAVLRASALKFTGRVKGQRDKAFFIQCGKSLFHCDQEKCKVPECEAHGTLLLLGKVGALTTCHQGRFGR